MGGALWDPASPRFTAVLWEDVGSMRTPLCPPGLNCGGSRTRLEGRACHLGFLVSFALGAFSGCLGPFGLRPCGHRARPCPEVRAVSCCISDYAKGFGGKYGVQKDRMDKVSASHLPQSVWEVTEL